MADPFAKSRVLTSLFTKRQRQVLNELAHGRPNKIIAYNLKLDPATVAIHIASCIKKVRPGMSSTELAIWYIAMKPTAERRQFLDDFIRNRPCGVTTANG